MKRLLALLLCFVMIFALVACSEGPASKKDKDDKKEDGGKDKSAITLGQTVVVDNSECLVMITGAKFEEYYGLVLKVYVENKSAETTYCFSTKDTSVNGMQCGSSFYETVAPGKKANGILSISESSFSGFDIGDYTDIETTFYAYDEDNYDYIFEETVRVFPFGYDKAVAYTHPAAATDVVIVDNEYATVTVVKRGYDEYNDYYNVELFIQSKCDKGLHLYSSDESVNGYMVDGYMSSRDLTPGKCEYATLEWSVSDLKENDISTVSQIEFTLKIEDRNSWDTLTETTVKLYS